MNPHNKVNQDFIWVGEYSDGSFIKEFDLNTMKENNFYFIERQRLIRFGLFGHDMRLFFEVFGGHFKVMGQQYDFVYKTEDESYFLTGQPLVYNEIITYKDAESIAKMSSDPNGRFINRITQFNVGYKNKMNIKGINFSIRILLCIPFDKPVYFIVRLVSDKDLKGRLSMTKNSKELSEFDAPLTNGIGGEMKFLVK